MISIRRGGRSLLDADPALAAGPDRVLLVQEGPPLAWGALRGLVGALEARLGEARVDAALAAEAGPLSLCFTGLLPGLSPEQRERRAWAEAALDGFMTHNPMVYGALTDAWVRALGALLGGSGLTLVVPDALTLDPLEVEVLIGLARGHGVALTLGDPEDAPALEPLWQRSRNDVVVALLLLAASPDVVVSPPDRSPPRGGRVAGGEPSRRRSDGGAPASTGPLAAGPGPWGRVGVGEPSRRRSDGGAPASTGPLAAGPGPWGRVAGGEPSRRDGAPDAAAWALLEGALDPAGAAAALDAVRFCFRGFAFTVALRLGLALLEEDPPLSPAERGELHALVALSAYNRQVRGEGDLALAALLETHFEAARGLLRDPGWQSHLLYRLTINTGRRKGALDAADAAAEASIRAADDPALPAGAAGWLRAWAINGRAYLHIRRRDVDRAIADELEALALLDGATGPGVPANEVEPTRAVLFDNMTRMNLESGRLEEARRWHRLLEQADLRAYGFVGPVPRMKAIAIARKEGRLAEALLQAEAGLKMATERVSPLYADLFAMETGDLAYRLGRPARAWEVFRQASALRARVAEPDDLFQAELAVGLAARRVGDTAAAASALEALLAHPRAEQATVRAGLLAWLGLLAAEAGDEARADERINAAIALAVERGERDLLLTVALRAGAACVALGRAEQALEAYVQALDIADSIPDAPAPAALRWAAWLGLARLSGEPGPALEALALLPAALADAETWADLPLLAEVLAETSIPEDAALAAGAAALRAGLDERAG